jgi:acyl-CoA thioesterase-1
MRSGFGVIGRGARGAALAAVVLMSAAACDRGSARAAADGASRGRGGGRPSDAPADSGAVSRRTERGRVLFVGTSLTAGLGLDPSESFPAVVAAKIDSAGLPFEVVNAGVSGETSAGALRRIDWLLREPVDVVVLETGANDGLRGVPVATVRANIQAIVDRVKAARPEARMLLVQMEALPNLGPQYTGAFRAVYPELARANGLTLVPFLLEGVAGRASMNQGDGIHPTAEGARVAAATVWASLEPVLEERAAALDAPPVGQ